MLQTREPASRPKCSRKDASLPQRVAPQLCKLVTEAPDGDEWAHEIEFDGYRMHARVDHGQVRLLTRNGLDWTHRYGAIVDALRTLPAETAYLDGELCALGAEGLTSFAGVQAATDAGTADGLVYFVFDLLHLNGEDLRFLPLLERKERLRSLLKGAPGPIQCSDHHIGDGPVFHKHACEIKLEGVVSKRLDSPYKPGDRGAWVKTKCLNREEFVVVGWSDPEGRRHRLGALLLAYYDPDGRLVLPAGPEPA